MSTMTAIDNAASVAKMYEAFGHGDINYIITQLDSNCKWIGAGGEYLPTGGTYVGKDVMNFFLKLNDTVDFSSFIPIAILNIVVDEAIAFGNMSGKSKLTGKPSSFDWAMHWKFNNEGKVVYYQDFYNTAAAYVANQQ